MQNFQTSINLDKNLVKLARMELATSGKELNVVNKENNDLPCQIIPKHTTNPQLKKRQKGIKKVGVHLEWRTSYRKNCT